MIKEFNRVGRQLGVDKIVTPVDIKVIKYIRDFFFNVKEMPLYKQARICLIYSALHRMKPP